MVKVDVLALAIPIAYKFNTAGKVTTSHDFDNALSVANTLYGHSRIRMPSGLLLIGY